MKIRAKFECLSVNNMKDGSLITLVPVVSGSPENEQFFKWTPAGKIETSVVSSETAKQFEPGKQYYVDFTPAD